MDQERKHTSNQDTDQRPDSDVGYESLTAGRTAPYPEALDNEEARAICGASESDMADRDAAIAPTFSDTEPGAELNYGAAGDPDAPRLGGLEDRTTLGPDDVRPPSAASWTTASWGGRGRPAAARSSCPVGTWLFWRTAARGDRQRRAHGRRRHAEPRHDERSQPNDPHALTGASTHGAPLGAGGTRPCAGPGRAYRAHPFACRRLPAIVTGACRSAGQPRQRSRAAASAQSRPVA
jgi:hypothetical protein